MGKEYTARSFKSGNSIAIRVPAALGVRPGQEWSIVEDHGSLILREKPAASDRIDLSGIYGSMPNLKPLSPEDRVLQERRLDWRGDELPRG
jgi:antitoxin VapB